MPLLLSLLINVVYHRLITCLNCGIDMLVMGSGSEFQSTIVLGKNEYFMQSLLVEMIL